MRYNFRIKIGNFTFFAMFSHTQTIEGVASKVGKDEHIILCDIEECNLKDAKRTLKTVQEKYRLGDIHVYSDAPKSFRAWCFSRRNLRDFLHILLDIEYLDYQFLNYTVKRKGATLRTSNKKDRKPQKLVAILEGFEETSIPKKLTHVIYDTGVEKRGKTVNIELGGERRWIVFQKLLKGSKKWFT
jgi:hypothetical protein